MERAPANAGASGRGAARALGPEIRRALEETKRRWRSVRLLEGAALLVAAAGLAVVLLFGLDNAFDFAPGARFALLLAAVSALGALGAGVLFVRPRGVPSDEECALLVERGHANLEDRLVNAVTFRRAEHRGLEAAAVAIVEEEAAARLSGLPWKEIVSLRRARRLAGVAAALLLAVAAYAALLPARFQNALERYARPFADVPPLAKTRLLVTPGDVEVPFGGSLAIRVETEGQLPESATLHTSSGAATRLAFDGRAFEIRLAGIEASFSYHVRAGDARSREFRVTVVRPPEVKNLDVTIEPPAYAELPARVERGSTGNVEALRGSLVRLDLEATQPLASAEILRRGAGPIDMERVSPSAWRAAIPLLADVEYSFSLASESGATSPEIAPRRRLKALPDLPPECAILDPPEDVEVSAASPAGFAVRIRVADDVGLARAALLAAPLEAASEEADAWRPIEAWQGIRREREAVLVSTPDLSALARSAEGAFAHGAAIRALAVDLRGSTTLSSVRRIRFLEPKEAERRAAAALEALRSDLSAVLRRERLLESETAKVQETRDGSARARERLRGLGGEQVAIRGLLAAALVRSSGALRGAADALEARAVRRELERAASDLMPKAALELLSAAAADSEPATADPDVAARPIDRALAAEREAIAILERALADLEGRIAALRSAEEKGETLTSPLAGPRTPSGKLAELLDRVREFQAAQKEVLARTQAFEDRLPEDFSPQDAKALEELAASEENWGRVLEEKAVDLSKVPSQDASVAAVAEEVLELVEEIDLARDYLKGKNVELAVPVEESGLALAEKIETNIERWLLRDRDRLKWVMEEPAGEFDVPLADLPSELEDIVGDLADREELMTEETEDVTSSWLDSMDDGIGWDAMDGPISNMTAKGVTGNLLPNDMEIGGRSGEGRSGKSHGQIVEETASGKGGRQTPSRSTPGPFEAGSVKDSGRDPTGGATGGGKLAGAAPPGLRGPSSPQLERRIGDLADRQVRIREDAEKLDLALRKRRHFAQSLTRALELMKALEEGLRAGRPANYAGVTRAIASELRALERAIAAGRSERLAEAGLPASLEHEALDAAGEEIPAQYESLIRDYYRSLGRGRRAADAGGQGGGR